MENAFSQLRQTMKTLRSENGCPWDREQTLETLKAFLVEETYEVLEAIDKNDPKCHLEELGDLLFQIVFQSQIRDEQGEFDFEQVAEHIDSKMKRRHPHVFTDPEQKSVSEVVESWQKIKEKERQNNPDKSAFATIPKALPGLLKARRLSEKAAVFGLDWSGSQAVRKKVDEELGELDKAILTQDLSKIEAELGDLIFTLVNLARHLNIDAEQSLQKASKKFELRARVVENLAKSAKLNAAQIDREWENSKTKFP